MALFVVLASTVAARVTSLIGGHRTVAAGVLLMVVGLLLFARLGAGASFAALIPGFAVFGIGIGLMNVPLTTAVLDGLPAEHAGIASALLNNSREVAGLLGITVIGAVLRAQQGISLRAGASAPQAFLDGYHAGLWVTIGQSPASWPCLVRRSRLKGLPPTRRDCGIPGRNAVDEPSTPFYGGRWPIDRLCLR